MSAQISSQVVDALRGFFVSRGFVEIYPQPCLSVLAACEDPTTVVTFEIGGQVWPLPQTNQIHLEYELLPAGQKHPGCFCLTTAYRNEPKPIPGRHDLVFPMFEFEAPGNLDDLRQLEADLLDHLGFSAPRTVRYENACQRFGVSEIGVEQEALLCERHGGPVFLEFFPQRSHPFWNMKRDDSGLYRKIDVLLDGVEVIGSAERETGTEKMREGFFSVSDGQYAQLLLEEFGRERVLRELEEYLAFEMFPRCGGGIGLTRLQRVLREGGKGVWK